MPSRLSQAGCDRGVTCVPGAVGGLAPRLSGGYRSGLQVVADGALAGGVGDAAAGSAALEELLADYPRVLGPDHPDTLATRASLN
jgi:hypothetical protein